MKFSLNKKAILLILCIALIIGTFAIAIYNKGLYDAIVSQYETRSKEITRLVSVEIDKERLSNVKKCVLDIYNNAENKVMSDMWGSPEFEDYISQFEEIAETDDYKSLLADLRRMQDSIDVDCLYITWIDMDNKCYVYLVDAAYEEPCPIGCIDPIFASNTEDYLRDISKGVAPNISNTEEYGWLISTGMPIFDEDGGIIATVAVDIEMNDVMTQIKSFMAYIGLAFLVMSIVVCVVAILLMNKVIVKPINKLSKAAAQYKQNGKAFSELNLKRKDEIGVLADSMAQMEEDINKYINDVTSAREHAEKMDRAANVDALTKVGNKRAYDIEADRLNKSKAPYGIVLVDMNDLKGVNDTYGHEKGDLSLIKISGIICKAFDRSSVYRVGGDEFVVILENGQYENREELMRKVAELFKTNGEDDSLQPWERVTAAAGCAIYQPETDDGVDSVLQRADELMYENKKLLKRT